MRATSACLFAIATLGGFAACDGLADDSDPGREFGRLQVRLTGEVPDDVQLQLAIVWRGGPIDGEEGCSLVPDATPIVQAVAWSATDDNLFRIELDGPPPAGAVHGAPEDADADDGGDGEDGGGDGGAIPTEHAEGVLVAFDDRDRDGRLDLCSESTCTDVVLGASNPRAPFLPGGVLREDPDAEGGWSVIDEADPDQPVTLVYVEDAWKPYGVREIPAGYAVWRTDADVAAGERFLDTFDPAIDIEVPLVDSPSLDELSCDGGCIERFARGAPDCPDLETSWCTLRPELPPEGARYHFVDCTETSTGETVCTPVWELYTITGCTRRFDEWHGCPVDYDSVPDDPDPDPAAWDWSCLDPA